MKKITKNLKSVMSAILAAAVLASICVTGFAAADPTENTVITELNDGWGDNNPAGGFAQVDFSTVDANDTSHGMVQKYSYRTVGGVMAVSFYQATEQSYNTDKLVSFDFYIYDNTIPWEIRFTDGTDYDDKKQLGTIDINFTGAQITNPNEKAKIRFNSDSNQTAEVTNQVWHKAELLFKGGTYTLYIDGAKVGSAAYTNTLTFKGIQFVSRDGQQATTVNSLSGLYLDNYKTVAYSEDAQFYGMASASDSEVTVELSESVAATYRGDFSSVKVYNTKTGEAVSTGAVSNSYDKITIPLNTTLESGIEYLIKLPSDLTSVTGKTLFGDVYFTVLSGVEPVGYSVNFNDYSIPLTANTTDLVLADPGWYGAFVNVIDSGDVSYGNVLKSTNYRNQNAARNLRFGVKAGNESFDVTKGDVTVEFDMRLAFGDYTMFYMQPYSAVDGGVDAALVNPSTYSNQYCTVALPTETQITGADQTATGGKAWMEMSTVDHLDDAAKDYATLQSSSDYAYTLIPKGDWFKVKYVVSKIDGAYNVKVYVNNELMGETSKGTSGHITDYLRGIRFRMEIPDGTSYTTRDCVQIDNISFTGYKESSAVIEKIRVYNRDGESFGPLSTGVKASAEKMDVYFGETVDISEAAVTLTSAGGTVTTALSEYDTVNSKVTATFDKILDKNAEYTVTVSGVKTAAGETVADYSVKLTTSAVGEFLIEDFILVDGNGNQIDELSDVSAGSSVYGTANIINTTDDDKKAVVITAAYNNMSMQDVKHKEFSVEKNSKTTIKTDMPVTVESLTDLVLKSFVWEGLSTNKPMTDAYICNE